MGTSRTAELFAAIDEPYAAGLFETPERSLFYRHCCAYARWFDAAVPPVYKQGEKLYPRGRRYFEQNYRHRSVKPLYATTYEWNKEKFKEKCAANGMDDEFTEMEKFWEISHNPFGWTHGSPNYSRIVREGLDSYCSRILKINPDTAEKSDFREGLIRLTDAMKAFAGRCIDYLISVNADCELIAALKKVPFKPAESYYEGLVCWNTIFYFDGCDNLGCLDRGLRHLYKGENLTAVIEELFSNIDAVDMWSCAIGPEYNEITRQALRAVKGKRRPLLELRVTDEMPDDIWEIAAEDVAYGGGSPSFYNEKGIHDMLHARFPQISDDELKGFCGGGCTETNLEGITHAGGTDKDVNLLEDFEKYLYSSLAEKQTFEEFFEGACRSAEKITEQTIDFTENVYRYRAEYLPHPMRTLLWDDCIDRAGDFNNGGARYNWTMNSESGLINVIDCLAAVKDIYYDKKLYSADEFLTLLKEENKEFFALLKACPCFGTDNAETDEMGAEFARRVFSVYRNKKPTLEFLDGFTLTEHQFTRYEASGRNIGPTPDGRCCGQPTCDSISSLRGKAAKGPTAMLCSASRLPQHLVDGISVANLTLNKEMCRKPEILKPLILSYFNMGGIQVQVTATSAEELKDALAHPERHADLIVRVGGYSEYFTNLSPALRQAVVERDVHNTGE